MRRLVEMSNNYLTKGVYLQQWLLTRGLNLFTLEKFLFFNVVEKNIEGE